MPDTVASAVSGAEHHRTHDDFLHTRRSRVAAYAMPDRRRAALQGSSFYDLPRLLHWFTASIGFHHIHHLVSKVPNYRLQACYRHIPELRQSTPLTLWASLKSVRLALRDEERQRLVSFRQVAMA